MLLETRLLTVPELAHFIRGIPYLDEQLVKPNVIISPDFLLALKKGSIQDHAVLMASLFMGAKAENQEELKRICNAP